MPQQKRTSEDTFGNGAGKMRRGGRAAHVALGHAALACNGHQVAKLDARLLASDAETLQARVLRTN